MKKTDHVEYPAIAFILAEPESALREDPVQLSDTVVYVSHAPISFLTTDGVKEVAKRLIGNTPHRCLYFEAMSAPGVVTDRGSIHVADSWLK